jgi:hypothetical protein
MAMAWIDLGQSAGGVQAAAPNVPQPGITRQQPPLSQRRAYMRKGGQPRRALPLLMRVAFDCAAASQSTKKPEVAGSEAEMSLKYAKAASANLSHY